MRICEDLHSGYCGVPRIKTITGMVCKIRSISLKTFYLSIRKACEYFRLYACATSKTVDLEGAVIRSPYGLFGCSKIIYGTELT
jgi:hypothetical protein